MCVCADTVMTSAMVCNIHVPSPFQNAHVLEQNAQLRQQLKEVTQDQAEVTQQAIRDRDEAIAK